jgi:radical SAM-linked protein
MDPLDEIARKQRLLRETANGTRPEVRLKYHERGISHVEGVLSRGDRRVAAAIEAAWRDGARFDGWDELFDLSRWQRAFAATGVDPARYLDTIPVRARLPWDHIDIGLEDGFLLDEYRRAMKDRLSPPCGKPVGSLLHHTNVADAAADTRKLVCFDCGVACDMTQMREDRVVALRSLGALEPARAPSERRPPRDLKPKGKRQPAPEFTQGEGVRYRLRYTKLQRAAFISHLDVMRLLARIFRRADVPVNYTLGFHPKPNMTFAPALGLGVPSFGELVDVRCDLEIDADELRARLDSVAPEGLRFLAARRVPNGERSLAKVVHAADYLIGAAGDLGAAAAAFLARSEAPVTRGEERIVDARKFVLDLQVIEDEKLARALEWEPRALLRGRVSTSAEGSVKPSELLRAIGLGEEATIARLALIGISDGREFDPLCPNSSPAGGMNMVGWATSPETT